MNRSHFTLLLLAVSMLYAATPASAQAWSSPEEQRFRAEIEARKDVLLAERIPLVHPVLYSAKQRARALKNVADTTWGREWRDKLIETADYVVAQPPDWVDRMISPLTPWHDYGFTCPNCVSQLSQEGGGKGNLKWDYKDPDVVVCGSCAQRLPDPKFPETAELDATRSGQKLTFFRNDEERAHPDASCRAYAWRWVDLPVHPSFSGVVRMKKDRFMLESTRSLALAYWLTGEGRYADRCTAILVRLAECFRGWLYHDYWDTLADCDPLYAAWHDTDFPRDWKKHLCTEAYGGDSEQHARMMQGYWGAGQFYPSTGGIALLQFAAEAYDLVYDATAWTPATRARLERDLLLEWTIESEPYLGGEGKSTTVNNKSPSVYVAHAAVARCLGIVDFARVAWGGYEQVRDKSFRYDGFSTESPGYTDAYLMSLLNLPELLNGFPWPPSEHRSANLYASDKQLWMMYVGERDRLQPNGALLPLSDTQVDRPASRIVMELGLVRYPELFQGLPLKPGTHGSRPGEFAILNFDAKALEPNPDLELPETYFPAWMTAILRHGRGTDAAVLTLAFSTLGGHRQRDSLSLYYRDRGRAVLGDLGYMGNMPQQEWVRSSFSHNIVIVDGTEQTYLYAKPRLPALQLLAFSPQASIVEATSNVYAQCSEYRRLVALVKGPQNQTFAIDVFRVKGGQEHDYRVFSELASSDASDGTLTFTGVNVPPQPAFSQPGASLKREDIFGLRNPVQGTPQASGWQATWHEGKDSFRLWMLSPVDTVQAAEGPGQEDHLHHGRRVRYLDAIRGGPNLASTFVVVHEPSGMDGQLPIRKVELVPLPPGAGPDALALRINSAWGQYLFFYQIAVEVVVDDVRFSGACGLVCRAPDNNWLLSVGASTLHMGRHGFEGITPRWSGSVAQNDEAVLQTQTRRPQDWRDCPRDCTAFVVTDASKVQTGFPVAKTSRNTILAERFPLQHPTVFALPAVRRETWK